MAKKAQRTMEPGVEDHVPDSMPAPKATKRQEFGRRLQQKILSKGWRQSDLARATGIGKDSISHYIRGRSFPGPKALDGIAKALGVSVTDLMPDAPAAAVVAELPALELRQMAGQPGVAWLRVNRAVSFSTAAKIIDLLQADDEARKS